MKKLLTALLIAAFLVIPVQGAAPAAPVDAPDTGAAEAMAPAIHGALLAMSHLEADRFDPADGLLAWEALYNTLSLYGQLDERAEYAGEDLVFPAETAADFAAALLPGGMPGEAVPGELADRMSYISKSDSYRLVCGSDDLVQVTFSASQWTGEALLLDGALVYEPDGSQMLPFRAALQPRDNMFGFTLAELVLL